MKKKTLIISLSVVAIIIVSITLFVFFIHPNVIMSVASPNGEYEAYVVEEPSFDPPNQSLFIRKKESNSFNLIDILAEDVDCIKKIIWSPDNKIVVFNTNDYLIITKISNFNSVKIRLSGAWKWKDKNQKTFASFPSIKKIEKIEFIDSVTVRVKFEKENTFKEFNLNNL